MSVISDRRAEGDRSTGESRTGVTLADRVPANTDGQDVEYEIPAAATLERLQVRIYQGAELSLQIRPYVDRHGGPLEELIELAGKDYIDGDDDVYEWDLAVPVGPKDELVIRATNTDGSNAYDYRAIVDLDYQAGGSRALSRVWEVLR